MSSAARADFRPIVRRWLIILAITAILLLLIAFQGREHRRIYENARRAEARRAIADLVVAMKTYKNEYGFPVGGELLQILSTLRGENPRKIVFIEVRETRINPQGELVDPWGMPYRFDLSKSDVPRVWSCGPNRKDEQGAEGSDDIVSWR